MSIGWPQGAYLLIAFYVLLRAAVLNGQPRSNESFVHRFAAFSVAMTLLWAGGFFG